MTRPRRQIMARGNDAIANSKGKTKKELIAEKTIKLAEKKTRKEKSKFTMAEEDEETPMELDENEEKKPEEKKRVRKTRVKLQVKDSSSRNSRAALVSRTTSAAVHRPILKSKPINRKRSLQEPSTSVSAVKRLRVIEPLPRHQRGVGYVLTLGQGDVGQLGLGSDIMERTRPSLVKLPSKMVDICAGGMHTVCLSEDGKVFTFGCNDEGALGRDTSEEGSEYEAGEVEIDGHVIQISAGDSHTVALTDKGDVYAWGTFRDSSGAMGLLEAHVIQPTPKPVLAGVTVAKIASGSDHLALLTTQGNLYTCGCAEQGQLGRVAECFSARGGRKGLGLLLNPGLAIVRRKKGKQVLFDDVWTGSYATFVRSRGLNEVYVCGLNNYYQLGSRDIRNRYVFERSDSFSSKSWNQISGGQHHTLALDECGDVYAMGRKEYGRLGLGLDYEHKEAKDVSTPMPILELKSKNCVDIACGVATSYAVDSSGRVYAWGMGTNFALGTGEEEDVYSPNQILGKQLQGKKTIAVSGGGQHAVLLVIPDNMKDEAGPSSDK